MSAHRYFSQLRMCSCRMWHYTGTGDDRAAKDAHKSHVARADRIKGNWRVDLSPRKCAWCHDTFKPKRKPKNLKHPFCSRKCARNFHVHN